ncbi:unnamed protein product [Cylicocyclus nassatus]|uniref:Uncharacterized protein n=1 Tax=Cylicocyclus nassatus TaxID=53992 RepID=A0AA36M610_CYLNA|nr:unnamed protein product [Cylicocyclus nassatus]
MTASVVAHERSLDYIFSTIYSTYSILGIILNSYVLLLTVTQKHNSIKEYRILLGNSSCALLLLSLLTFFLQIRFVIVGDSLGYVALGPMRFLDMPRLALFCTALFLAIDFYAFMTIAMCMVYKFATLKGKSASEKQLFVAAVLFSLLPISTGVALLVDNPDFSELHVILNKLKPEYELQRYGNYCGLPDVKNIYVMYLITVLSGIAITSFVVMVTIGFQMRSFFIKNANSMSTKNAQMFKRMVKALILQSFMPLVFSFPGIILYMLQQFLSFRSIAAEYLTISLSPLVVVVDPCITIFYVLPYRRNLSKSLGVHQKVSRCVKQQTLTGIFATVFV